MDRTTVIGLVVAVSALILSVLVEHGSLLALGSGSAAILVFGGTIGATVISVPARDLMRLGGILRAAFTERGWDAEAVIRRLVEYAQFARREGLLALDARLDEVEDPFLRSGLQAVVDGVDPELVRGLMETQLAQMEERHRVGAGILETAGGFAPTMGIIGTVMGLVHVLSNLGSAATLGPAIATAFIATLYGISSANLLWLPLAAKLRARTQEEVLVREMMVEGILSLQAGESPRVLEDKLRAFLPAGKREAQAAAEAVGREMAGPEVR